MWVLRRVPTEQNVALQQAMTEGHKQVDHKGFQIVSRSVRMPTSPIVRTTIRNLFTALAEDDDITVNDKEEDKVSTDAGGRSSSSPNG